MAIGEALMALQGNDEITPGEITPKKLSDLQVEIEACGPEQTSQCVAILDAAILRAKGTAISGLQGLRDNIEQIGNMEYSLDGLIEHVGEDEKAKAFLTLYQSQISNDLGEMYGASYEQLGTVGQNTVQLILWDIIQSQLGLRGTVNIGVSQIGSLTEGFTNLFTNDNTPVPPEQESIIFRHMSSRAEYLNSVSDKLVTQELKDDLSKTIEIVESLIGEQADRLELLFQQTESMNMSESDKIQIFENPIVLRALLQKGRYKKNGFDINLSSDPIVMTIGNIDDLESIQNEFMDGLKEDSGKLGATMDRIKGLADKVEGLLGKFGIDGGLDGMKEMLYKIPLIGMFFKMILGDFFDKFDGASSIEAMKRAAEGLANLGQRATVLRFRESFLPKLTEDNPDHILSKYQEETGFTKAFVTDTSPFFNTLDTAEISYTGGEFWNNILLGKGGTQQEQIIYNRIKPLFNSSDFNEAKLITALNSIPASILVEASLETPDTEEDSGNLEGVIVPETVDFDEAVSFPFLFEGIQISYDVSNFDLKVGDNSFQITNIGDEKMNPVKLIIVSPSLQLQEENIIIGYTAEIGGSRKTVNINRNTFSNFLREIIAGESATLSIPHEDPTKDAIEILFTKIQE